MLEFDSFLKYAHVSTDDKELVDTAYVCYEAAMRAAEDSGISRTVINESPKCALYIYALALHYYENRGFMPVETSDKYRKEMMTQMRIELKYSGER